MARAPPLRGDALISGSFCGRRGERQISRPITFAVCGRCCHVGAPMALARAAFRNQRISLKSKWQAGRRTSAERRGAASGLTERSPPQSGGALLYGRCCAVRSEATHRLKICTPKIRAPPLLGRAAPPAIARSVRREPQAPIQGTAARVQDGGQSDRRSGRPSWAGAANRRRPVKWSRLARVRRTPHSAPGNIGRIRGARRRHVVFPGVSAVGLAVSKNPPRGKWRAE